MQNETPRRLGTTVSDPALAAAKTFTLTKDTDYRLAAIVQPIVCKFAATVAAGDADAFVVSPNEALRFNSGDNTQLSVIEKTASAAMSLTVLKQFKG